MTRSAGRPRSEDSRRRVLAAARDLLRESGVRAVSMDAVASRAHVSKQTLYRWWGSTSAIVVEAVLDGYEPPVPETVVETGDLRADIASWIERSARSLSDDDVAQGVRALLGAVSSDPVAGREFHDRTLAPARRTIEHLLSADEPSEQTRSARADIAISALLFWVLVDQPVDAGRRDALRDLLTGSGRTGA
ncbi:MAG: TetR/AcrR family transcriptional regulator [Microbacterium sp.]|uniref:TetR/AcrR family transcriptional regulator n=1 Tax=Microbacterium sp. TaxID=51671 RepID=UPI003D6E47C0